MRPSRQFCAALCLSALAAIPHVHGQTSSTPVASAPATAAAAPFAAEPMVITSRKIVLTMHADGTGVRDTTLAARLQTDAAVRQLGVVNLLFASASEHAEFLYVRVRHPDGTVTETPVSGALEQPTPVTREAPFYSDQKALQLPVKNLGVGDTLEWQARVTRTVPEAPGQFWSQEALVNDGVALADSFELRIPAASHITLWTNPAVAAPQDTTVGAERTIRWSGSHLVPSVGPSAEAAKKDLLTPEQELSLRKGVLPSFAWTTFPNWEAVGAWYRGLEADRTKPDAAITAKVAQLTAGKATQQEKAQAVYEYVATQIRYIGVAFGVGRYQPHTAAEVLANQYGDCKDKHTLLAAMLTQLGLQPEAVLIGAGVRFIPTLPSPGAFNHLITHVTVDGKPVWLDTTAEVAPWATLYPNIRDQQALVIPALANAHIETTPPLPPFAGFASLGASETLDKDLTSDARITLTFHDDDELGLRALLRQASPAQYPEFLQRFVAAMGFGGTASDPEISRPDDLDHPLTISYRYKRVKEADWGENRVTEPFWPISLPAINEKEPPISSIELGTPRTETSTVDMRLPQGWSAELPEAIHTKTAFAETDMTFRLKDGVVTGERKLTILQPRVAAQDWKAYKQWADDAQINSYPFVQLITSAKTSLPKSKAENTATPADSGEAQQLVSKATEAERRKDTTEARSLLDRAKAINPQQRYLWSNYAWVSYMLGEITKGTEEAQKELQFHPDEPQTNGLLATLYNARGNHEEAIAALRRWRDAAPDRSEPALALMTCLHQLKRDNEAIATGTSALAQLSKGDADLVPMRLELAFVQQQAGKRSDAANTILPIAKSVTDLDQQNSVAYTLADAKIDLPGDEAMERNVLGKLDSETAAWTMDETPAVLFSRTSLLVASWDTMGWILFQQGKLPDARTYVLAAWQNAPSPESLEHLHTIDAAMHQPTREDAGSEQSRRTFALGAAHGHHGTAELTLLLGEGKVLRAQPASSANAGKKSAPDLADAPDLVRTADLHTLFPNGSGARLVRRGFVNCSSATCQLVLEPLSAR